MEIKLRRIGITLHATVRSTQNIAQKTIDVLDSMCGLNVSECN